MPTIKRIAPWLRAIGVLAAVGVIIGRVTFAALQSQQAVLTGNTIESATAALQISTDGGNFATTQQGFSFSGVIPGGAAMPQQNGGRPLWFKNTGTAPIALKAMIASAPTTTGDIDLSKVFVVFTPAMGGSSQSVSLAALQQAAQSGGVAMSATNMGLNQQIEYSVQVSMANDAFSGNSATINDLNLVFVGAAVVSA
jgi:hypothetical protein